MFTLLQKAIIIMALLRVLSGSIELFAAFLMLRFNNIEKALVINGSLSLIGPLFLIISVAVGLYDMADKIPIQKMIWIVLGVVCILYGVKSG